MKSVLGGKKFINFYKSKIVEETLKEKGINIKDDEKNILWYQEKKGRWAYNEFVKYNDSVIIELSVELHGQVFASGMNRYKLTYKIH